MFCYYIKKQKSESTQYGYNISFIFHKFIYIFEKTRHSKIADLFAAPNIDV